MTRATHSQAAARADKPDARERRRIAATTHLAYRPDIDGLRTLAVVPVVLNHAGVPGVWGGFVGVDIFFVISGFLITGILVRDVALGRHSISGFYRRRVLRIFPALFAMLTAVTLVASLTLLPDELVRFARSLAATALFGSNFVFWGESGYFAPAAHIKPLLHTWSLAIEEQFYILWPLVIAAIGAGSPMRQKVVVLAVTIGSFAAAVWLVARAPSAAFYLLPARAWELSVGALIALGTVRVRNRWANEALAMIGLALVLWAMRRFTESTPFPGAAALLPCVGAALLISTGGAGTLMARGFALPPMVWTGRISYSLYLWHWPVIVFAELALFLPKTPLVIAGEVALSFILAWLSYWFVERPFRHEVSGWRTPRVLQGALAAITASLAVAGAIAVSGGLPGRFDAEQQRIGAYQGMDGDQLYRGGRCFKVGDRDVFDPACLTRSGPLRPVLLFMGDSHAAHLWPGLSAYRARFDVLQATRTGCRPVRVAEASAGSCGAFFDALLTRGAATLRPSATLLAGRWTLSDVAAVKATLADPRVRALRPVLIGPVPQYTTALPRLLVFASRRGDPGLPARALVANGPVTDRALRAVAAEAGVPYISMIDLLCRGGACQTMAGDAPLLFDYGHFTAEGSRMAVAMAMPGIVQVAQ